jgi:hypothetical protein
MITLMVAVAVPDPVILWSATLSCGDAGIAGLFRSVKVFMRTVVADNDSFPFPLSFSRLKISRQPMSKLSRPQS